MTTALTPTPDEAYRLEALRNLQLLDTPLEERFERITRLAKRVLGVEIAAVSLVDQDRQFFKSIQGLEACQTPRSQSFCAHAIHGDEALVVPDAREDPRFADNPLVTGEPHIVAYAGVPVQSIEGAKVGTLCVISQQPRDFSYIDIMNLKDLAGVVETELRCSMSHATTATLLSQLTDAELKSRVDPLTRVWNRDGITDLLAEVLNDRQTYRDYAATLLIDLDGFKPVNDRYGHAAGDDVLREVSRRMISALRGQDAIGRVGGDEFVAVLNDCHRVDLVQRIGQRLLDAVEALPFFVERDSLNLSATIGGAVLMPGRQATAEAMINAADQAMYRGKEQGGARVYIDTFDD